MENQKKNSFSLRNFISVLLTFSFTILVITGIVLYVTPPGRVAHWTGWKMLGLGKDQWQAVHICIAICVLIASIFHISLNFKPLMNYFRNRLTNKYSFKPEWLAALVICFAVFIGTVTEIPPFSTIMNINHDLKFSWDNPARRPPIPHAENLTLAQLSKKAGLNIELAIENLKAANITPAKPETVIIQLAEKHKMNPEQIYNIALGKKTAAAAGPAYGGQRRRLGKKTLEEFCNEEKIELQTAIKILKTAGINAEKDQTLKYLADEAATNPAEIANMISKKN